MKRIFTLIAFFALLASGSFATIHEVEVGGIGTSSSNPPYYSPQNLTIQQGDTVRWTWVTSTHNVTSTSGPVSFSSGDHGSGHVFMVHFTVAGTYNYECSLFNHAATQFGSIVVDPAVGVEEGLASEVLVYPVPFESQLTIDLTNNSGQTQVQVIEPASGRILMDQPLASGKSELPVAHLPQGVYLMVIRQGDRTYRQSLVKR